MDIKKKIINDSQVQLTIDIPVGMLNIYSDRAYKKLAANVKIPGFRPGKAPRHMVEREVGSDAFNKEILESAIQDTFYQAIVKEKVVTLGPPEIKVIKFVPTDGLTYEATVTTLPEVSLPDFKSIKIKKKDIIVEKKEIEEVIEGLRKKNADLKEVSRAAKEGDKVEVDFEGFLDNLPFEGGKSENHPLVLGSKTMIPGFEEGILGMKKDEAKEVEITFPKDYHAGHLADKKTKFKIKLNRLEEVILPELNDDFVKKVSPFKTVSEFRKDVEKRIRENKEAEENKKLEEELLEKAVEKLKVKVPETLIAEEVHGMMHELEHNLTHSGIEMEKYLGHIKKSKEELEKDMRVDAEKRVKIGLLISEIIKKEKISVSEDEVRDEIEDITKFIGPERLEEAKNFYDSPEGKRSVENNILTKKVIGWIKNQSEIE